MVYEGRDDRTQDGRDGLQKDLRVQRSEEEARAEVREREAGQVNVRKSVKTEREVVLVPKRREEVDIERVPVEGGASGATEAQIGEGEVVLQVFEEEIVVTKRVVLKEEIHLRKRVVEEEEIVEVDLRKEEVEIDDRTMQGAGGALEVLPTREPPAGEKI